jgi:hypothetical protein
MLTFYDPCIGGMWFGRGRDRVFFRDMGFIVDLERDPLNSDMVETFGEGYDALKLIDPGLPLDLIGSETLFH